MINPIPNPGIRDITGSQIGPKNMPKTSFGDYISPIVTK
jgi:hypothetical protein